MKYSLILVAWLVTAGCAYSRSDNDRTDAVVSGPLLEFTTHDERIVAYVSWLKRQGVALEYLESADGYGVWRVVQPKTSNEYEVSFHIRSFPTWASEEQMRESLDVNLAYVLNAQAHLAMSYAVISGTHSEAVLPQSEDDLPKVGGVPIIDLVEQKFLEYHGG